MKSLSDWLIQHCMGWVILRLGLESSYCRLEVKAKG
jgi:hypothetical protein